MDESSGLPIVFTIVNDLISLPDLFGRLPTRHGLVYTPAYPCSPVNYFYKIDFQTETQQKLTNQPHHVEATQGDATAPTTTTEINNVTADHSSSEAVASPAQLNNQINQSNKVNIMPNENFNLEGTLNPDNYIEALIIALGNDVPKRTRTVLESYVAAKRAGLKIAFLEGNRKVNYSQVQKLIKSIQGEGKFKQPCLVVLLQSILEKFPDLKVYDLDGNLITTEAPDVDMYVVPYDGQHRIAACELNPDIDVELELIDFDGENPLETIKLINSYSRNWNNEDLRTSNLSAGLTTNRLYEEAAVLQHLFGITRKLAEYILTFIRDATKKKDLVVGKDTTPYNEENGDRGREIYYAAFTNFQGAKVIKIIQFMDSIVNTYNGVSDTDKPQFRRSMKLYLGTLDETKRKKALSFINDKNYGQLDEFIKTGYANFMKSHTDESQLNEMETEVDSRIKSFIDGLEKKNQEQLAKKELKSGRVHEILEQHRIVETNRKEDAARKAKEKRDRAKADAKKAQDKADQAESDYQSLHNVTFGKNSAED